MTTQDHHGHALSGANAASRDLFEQGCHQFRCLIDNPLATAQAALEESPQMTMAHALVGWLNLLGTEPGGLPAARAALDAARAGEADEREAMHLAAIEHVIAGRWHRAGAVLEDLTIRWPHDALALQAGHQIDFFTGHSRMLRDRIARAVPAWREGMPGYHAVLGMYAFGLEECGDYARAEKLGRHAVALQPRDGWAWHAVAHVLEMQNRRKEGVQWLSQRSEVWAEGSALAVHNWWHLALFHLGLDEIDRVLELVDRHVLDREVPVILEMIDGSAMLWRLALRGVDVGHRWAALAERWAPLAEAGNYAFNDFHAMMAFVGADRSRDAERLLAAQERALSAGGDNVGFLRDVGHDATRALQAFGQGRYAQAVALLRPLRSGAARFGGSHAQRDLIDLTLIEAARRAGESMLAQALLTERAQRT